MVATTVSAITVSPDVSGQGTEEVAFSERVVVADGISDVFPVTSEGATVEFNDTDGMPVEAALDTVPVGRTPVPFADAGGKPLDDPLDVFGLPGPLFASVLLKSPVGVGEGLGAVPIEVVRLAEGIGEPEDGAVGAGAEELEEGAGTLLESGGSISVVFPEGEGLAEAGVPVVKGLETFAESVGKALEPVAGNDVKLADTGGTT
jgi:hypothetical protein